eukprot:2419159-Lingulodinium_polyedra.AAC.1
MPLRSSVLAFEGLSASVPQRHSAPWPKCFGLSVPAFGHFGVSTPQCVGAPKPQCLNASAPQCVSVSASRRFSATVFRRSS